MTRRFAVEVTRPDGARRTFEFPTSGTAARSAANIAIFAQGGQSFAFAGTPGGAFAVTHDTPAGGRVTFIGEVFP